MRKNTSFPCCMTLRLSTNMESELADLAYDLRLSRAGTIRRILGRAIADVTKKEIRIGNGQRQGGAL
ncbi:MAG TPA: hypothetical protein VE959_20085 [Bryobacteraceae bacterium]|nr:hypothetical protein [Bryobacteraceae bacterium]